MVCLLTLPFIHKPFHIDDDIYLKGAEQILRSPLDPLGGSQRLLGAVMPTYHFTQHPPLLSYYIVLVEAVSGRRDEALLHLSFIWFPLLAALAMYDLARRFTRMPLLATLLLVSTPAFLVMAHGLMTDMPFLALSLAATAAFLRAVDHGRTRWFVLASLCLVLACSIQYRGALLAALLLSYALLLRRHRGAAVLTLAPAGLLLGLWSWWTSASLGAAHILDAGSWIEFQPARMLNDGVAYVAFLGGVTLFPPLLWWGARQRLRDAWAWILLATSLASIGFVRDYPLGEKSLFVLCFSTGALALWRLMPDTTGLRRFRDAIGGIAPDPACADLFLLLMVVVPLLSQVSLNLFASVRSLLIALPFLILIVVRQCQEQPRGRVVMAVGCGLTLALGVLLAVADLRYAEAAREVAQVAARRPSGGGTRWFTGEWGFRHYIERAGLESVSSDGQGVAVRDTLIMPDVPCPAWLEPAFVSRLRLAETIESRGRFPIKLMSFADHAGFYSNFHGHLPFSFSSAPLERVRVFRVENGS